MNISRPNEHSSVRTDTYMNPTINNTTPTNPPLDYNTWVRQARRVSLTDYYQLANEETRAALRLLEQDGGTWEIIVSPPSVRNAIPAAGARPAAPRPN